MEKKYYVDTDVLLGKEKQRSVSVSPVQKYSQTYHPARITYTGITIGGVHTGSINVQDEYFSISTSRTSKGKVLIEGVAHPTIHLSGELLAIAKNDPVLKNNIFGNELKLKGQGRQVGEAEMLNMLRGNDVIGSNDYLNSQADACYTMEFCVRAADFIAGALDGKFLTEKQRQDGAAKMLKKDKAAYILISELLAGYNEPQSKELLQKAIDSLLSSENPEYWELVKNYLEKHSSDETQSIIQDIEKNLSTQTKYEIDGQVFYDKKKYDSYVWKKEWDHRQKMAKIKVTIISILGCLFAGGVGLMLLFMMGIL